LPDTAVSDWQMLVLFAPLYVTCKSLYVTFWNRGDCFVWARSQCGLCIDYDISKSLIYFPTMRYILQESRHMI